MINMEFYKKKFKMIFLFTLKVEIYTNLFFNFEKIMNDWEHQNKNDFSKIISSKLRG